MITALITLTLWVTVAVAFALVVGPRIKAHTMDPGEALVSEVEAYLRSVTA